MSHSVKPRVISYVPPIYGEGEFIKNMPIPPTAGKNKSWIAGLSPHDRLFYQQTFCSARRFAGFKPYPFIPMCSTDIALSANYHHDTELFADKVDVVLQPETMGKPTFRYIPSVMRDVSRTQIKSPQEKATAQSNQLSATGQRPGSTQSPGTNQLTGSAPEPQVWRTAQNDPIIGDGHPAVKISGITERISPHSIKLINNGPHTPLTNPGYSRQEGDGNYYRY